MLRKPAFERSRIAEIPEGAMRILPCYALSSEASWDMFDGVTTTILESGHTSRIRRFSTDNTFGLNFSPRSSRYAICDCDGLRLPPATQLRIEFYRCSRGIETIEKERCRCEVRLYKTRALVQQNTSSKFLRRRRSKKPKWNKIVKNEIKWR